MLTVDEAAKHLRVSPDTIRRFLRDNKLRGMRVGGQWRIPAQALREAHSPLGEVLEEQVVTLIDHEVQGVKIPAGTLGYVVARSRSFGGGYLDTITMRETVMRSQGQTGQLPDIDLPLGEEGRSWKFMSNDGAARLLQIPRERLRELRRLLDSAYSATTEDDSNGALMDAYLSVRAMLGANDRSDDDALSVAIEAMWQKRCEVAAQATQI